MSDMDRLCFDTTKIDKIQELRGRGVTVYPYTFERKDTVEEIRERFSAIGHEKSEEAVSTAGRIYIVRQHGKTIFADMGDSCGRIQLYLRKNDLGEEQFELFKQYVDAGDIIGVVGHVFRTKMGEITIWVDRFELLTKSVCPLPEKFHGLKNVETRYRQRYLDLIMNDESRETFRTRSRIIALLRQFLFEREYLEFETPTLQPIYGGANARPFTPSTRNSTSGSPRNSTSSAWSSAGSTKSLRSRRTFGTKTSIPTTTPSSRWWRSTRPTATTTT